MSGKQGKSVLVRNKLRMLKRNNTMHIDFVTAPPGKSELPQTLQRHESCQSLDNEVIFEQGSDVSLAKPAGCSLAHEADQTVLDNNNKDQEQVELIQRRGRRRAVIDEQNLIEEVAVDNQECNMDNGKTEK
ncbi:hypothetical protein EG68_00448 [Paragonimus skrjabini miyazakii]|uniref:Uncharacterized protein n=1 Tax=Paragonimus skrjabini miyazakii TaxID=59628 RepID=A0A8S9Z484_9TREM|nr:hypothetical protein EG68_00448 [Paragonimus skrjabini miyazakii]